jgi:hypothetical protein
MAAARLLASQLVLILKALPLQKAVAHTSFR